MPVGTAIMAYPNSMMMDAINWPKLEAGAISPYPTVVRVTMAQYIDLGIDENPLLGPSTMYIKEPITKTIVNTDPRKI